MEVADKGSLYETDLNLTLKLIKNNQILLIATFNRVKESKKIVTIKLKYRL